MGAHWPKSRLRVRKRRCPAHAALASPRLLAGCPSRAPARNSYRVCHARVAGPIEVVSIDHVSKKQIAIVALGSNIGDSPKIIQEAILRLGTFSDQPLLKSSLWQTTPVDCPPGSPPFVNSVIGLSPRPKETPESLLSKLQVLEKKFGRQSKRILNEPRPLDLDFIAFGDQVRAAG